MMRTFFIFIFAMLVQLQASAGLTTLELCNQRLLVLESRSSSIPELLGIDGARFFGFQQITSKEMITPTADEFNRAVDAFNFGLSEDDPVRIKIKLSEQLTDSTDQSNRTMRQFKVQHFARTGEILIQDVSDQLLENIFANNELSEIIQGRALLWLDFFDRMAKIDSGHTQEFALWNDLVMEALANQIDHLRAIIGNYDGSSKGLDVNTVFSITSPPEHFFSTLAEQENISIYYPKMLETFLATQRRLHPERFKSQSYNVRQQVRKLSIALKETDPKKQEVLLANLPISKPYVERLKRLKVLTSSN